MDALEWLGQYRDLLHDLHGTVVEVKVRTSAAGVDSTQVEKIVERKLAERDRAQAIEERMNWQ